MFLASNSHTKVTHTGGPKVKVDSEQNSSQTLLDRILPVSQHGLQSSKDLYINYNFSEVLI